MLALLFCFVDKKNDIKTSCPKSKVEVLLLVLVLSPLYVYVEDMGKTSVDSWAAVYVDRIQARVITSLPSTAVSYSHIVLLNNIQKN